MSSALYIADGVASTRPNQVTIFIIGDISQHQQVVTLLHIHQGIHVPLYGGCKTLTIHQSPIDLLHKAWHICHWLR